MSNQMTKAKEWALKSGFPFENDTLLAINRQIPTSKIVRNIEFEASNEDGKPTIRSLDFAVSISKDTRNIPHRNWPRGRAEHTQIHFLVDCKYTADESYLFTPSSRPILPEHRCWPHLIPMMTKGDFGRTTTIHRKDLAELSAVDETIPFASSGRKVKEQSRERDSVSSALLQVLQGTQHFLKTKSETLGKASEVDSSYERNAYYFIPIIVTNAPLLILRKEISSLQVETADRKEQLFVEANQVIAEMPDIFDLKKAWEKLKSTFNRSKNESLEWRQHELYDGHVLFCNLIGFEEFLKSFSQKLERLSMEPQ